VIPILGPSTARDAVGAIGDYFTYPVSWIENDEWRYGLRGVDLLQIRADLLDKEKALNAIAVDEYKVVRDAYFQRREYLVTKGKSSGIDSSAELQLPD